jgi:hypothetical protein
MKANAFNVFNADFSSEKIYDEFRRFIESMEQLKNTKH